MTTIFLVKQNLKHNGTDYKVGQLVQDEFEATPNLVNDGVLRVIEGAESIQEAEAILAEEKEKHGERASGEAELQPENTWGPRKDEQEEVKPKNKPEDKKEGFLGKIFGGMGNIDKPEDKGEVYNGPMVKVRFIKDYEVVNENNEKTGEILATGTETEIPEPTVTIMVDTGFIEIIAPSEVGSDANKPEEKKDDNTGANL